MIKQAENLVYIAILGLVGVFGLWLQNSLIDEEVVKNDFKARHDPDYYIENFTATGMDKTGERRFVIEAKRMAHFPDDDTALLDYPHVIEYRKGYAPRHTYSDSGWMSSTGDEVILTGNVKIVVEASKDGPGGTMKSRRLRILLDEKKKLLDY